MAPLQCTTAISELYWRVSFVAARPVRMREAADDKGHSACPLHSSIKCYIAKADLSNALRMIRSTSTCINVQGHMRGLVRQRCRLLRMCCLHGRLKVRQHRLWDSTMQLNACTELERVPSAMLQLLAWRMPVGVEVPMVVLVQSRCDHFQALAWKLVRIFCICGVLFAAAAALSRSPMSLADCLSRSLVAAIFCRSSAVSRSVPSRCTSALSRDTSVCSLKTAEMMSLVTWGGGGESQRRQVAL